MPTNQYSLTVVKVIHEEANMDSFERLRFGTSNHLKTMRLLIEKLNEHEMHFAIAFVDCGKHSAGLI